MLHNYTTRTDGGDDSGIVDMGYHALYFIIIDSIVVEGNSAKIHWNQKPNTAYIVEWSEDMSSWTQVPVGQVGEWTDTNAGGYVRKFYRVKEE